jgi:flavodoxin
MLPATAPRVLLVYYSHTQQSRRVADVMAEVLRGRGCEVSEASIELTDPRYVEKFSQFPFKHAVFDLFSVLPAQARRKTGQIAIPEAARSGDYDLVCFGSPTWFFTTNLPLRSYLMSEEAGRVLRDKRFAVYVVCRRYWGVNMREVKKLATARGGTFVESIRFNFAGGQIRSLLSLLSYFGKGEMRERSLGIRIPPSNLKPDFVDQATAFANDLADGLDARRAAAPQPTTGGVRS